MFRVCVALGGGNVKKIKVDDLLGLDWFAALARGKKWRDRNGKRELKLFNPWQTSRRRG